jgi:hypothetical protein
MSEPTCRACYAATLGEAERQRFYAEPVTSCIYWCPDHQRAMDAALNSLPQVQFIKATAALFEPPTFAPIEPAMSDSTIDPTGMTHADKDGWHYDPPRRCGGIVSQRVDGRGNPVGEPTRGACEVHLMPWGHLPPGGAQ